MISMAREFEVFMLWHSSTKASRSIFILKNRDVSTPCKRILGQDWMRLLKSSELRPNSEVRKFKVISIFCLRDRSKISGTVTTKLPIWSLVKLHLCLIIATFGRRLFSRDNPITAGAARIILATSDLSTFKSSVRKLSLGRRVDSTLY